MQKKADALTRLTLALDGLASAMETGQPDAVLAAEAPLATAVSALRQADLRALAATPDARNTVLAVRLAVARCRTLGHASGMLAAVVGGQGYGPSGQRLQPKAPAATVISRT